MGQARRRKLNLRACAIHESAHVIAAFHFHVPITDPGVYIKPMGDSLEFSGYTNSRLDQEYGNLPQLSDERLVEYLTQAVIGPIAEYRFRNDRSDNPLRFWTFDIACAVGRHGEGTVDATTGCVRFSDTQTRHFKELTDYCLTVIDDPEKPAPAHIWPDGRDVGSDLKTAALLAETLREKYKPIISSFADALVNAAGMALSAEMIADWKDEHFIRQLPG